jgi:hypothetical protein
MIQTDDATEKLGTHMARLQAAGAVPMTVEEILAGETQAGVPRPKFLTDDVEQEAPHGAH